MTNPHAPYRLERPLRDAEATLGALCAALGLPVPAKPHVTIAWSARPVDWNLPIFAPDPHPLDVAVDDARLERFDDGTMLVLAFACRDIARRHAALRDAGASWSHPLYIPHVSLGRIVGRPAAIDPALVPQTLRFGPEHRRAP